MDPDWEMEQPDEAVEPPEPDEDDFADIGEPPEPQTDDPDWDGPR